MTNRFGRVAVALVFAAIYAPALAQTKPERLLGAIPSGYQSVQEEFGNPEVTRYLRDGETIDTASELIRIYVYFGKVTLTPQQHYEEVAGQYAARCNGAKVDLLESGNDRGYEYVLWTMSCPAQNNQSPDYSWLKAILGRDKFYVVSRLFRREPSSEQERRALLEFFRGVRVCCRESSVTP